MKDSIVFYRSFYEAITDLPLENQLELYDAIFSYGLNGNDVKLKGVSSSIFKLIKPQLDANFKRFENGNKGGRPKNQTETKHKPNHNLDITKHKPNVNDNDNVNDKENVNVNVSGFVKPTLADLEFILSRKEALKFLDHYDATGWMMGRVKIKDWEAAARKWKSNQYNNDQLNRAPRPKMATKDDDE